MRKIKKIRAEIIQKTGVDFEKYRKPEVVDTLTESVSFIINPLSVISVFLKSLIIVFAIINLVLGGWCYFQHTPIWVVILFFIIGNLAFPIVGISLGIMDIIKKLSRDIINALHITMDLVKEIIYDISKINPEKLPPTADIMKGVIFVVIIPLIRQIIMEKGSFLIKPLIWGFEKMLYVFSEVFTPIIEKIAPEDQVVAEGVKQINHQVQGVGKSKLIVSIDKVKPQIETVIIESVLPKVLAPIRFVFNLSSGITVFLLFILYLIFG